MLKMPARKATTTARPTSKYKAQFIRTSLRILTLSCRSEKVIICQKTTIKEKGFFVQKEIITEQTRKIKKEILRKRKKLPAKKRVFFFFKNQTNECFIFQIFSIFQSKLPF
jgi:hypothetical protein